MGRAGVPRATQDLDVWIEATPENANLVWQALVKFGARLDDLEIDPADFVRPATVIQIGLPPNRIDLLTWALPESRISRRLGTPG